MRTFIAIKITSEKKLLDIFSILKKSLSGESINWVATNNLHLTLRFLGETTHEQAQKIVILLENISQNYYPFQFKLKGIGIFKSSNKPRVLFVTVENDLKLKQLAAEIEEKIISLGFSYGDKAFNPHLTLGRIKFIQNKDVLYSLVNKFRNTEIQQVTVSEIIFYQSILSSDGPTYNPIEIIKFNMLK
jgi:2'-5' RNA ligase